MIASTYFIQACNVGCAAIALFVMHTDPNPWLWLVGLIAVAYCYVAFCQQTLRRRYFRERGWR